MSYQKDYKKNPQKGLFRRIGLFAVAIYFCFVMVDMKVTMAEKNDELIVKQQQLEEQRKINKDAQRQTAQGVNENEVERIARDNGYVKEGELVFKDSSGN